jgi:hypothetical protein
MERISMPYDIVYVGESEARARTAFYKAVKKAMHNRLVSDITVLEGDTIIGQVKPI